MIELIKPTGWTTVVKRNLITGYEQTVLNRQNTLRYDIFSALLNEMCSLSIANTQYTYGNVTGLRGFRVDGIGWGSCDTGTNSTTGSWAGRFAFGSNNNFYAAFAGGDVHTATFIGTFNFDANATVNCLGIGQGSCWKTNNSGGTQIFPYSLVAYQVMMGTSALTFTSIEQMLVKWYIGIGF
jgi:hypothetical protein